MWEFLSALIWFLKGNFFVRLSLSRIYVCGRLCCVFSILYATSVCRWMYLNTLWYINIDLDAQQTTLSRWRNWFFVCASAAAHLRKGFQPLFYLMRDTSSFCWIVSKHIIQHLKSPLDLHYTRRQFERVFFLHQIYLDYI